MPLSNILYIGQPVISGTANYVPYIGSSGLLAQSSNLQFNGTNFWLGPSASTLSGKMVVHGDTNLATADTDNIIVGYAQNLTQGFAIRYNGLYATGSNTNVALYFEAKASTVHFNPISEPGKFYIGGGYATFDGIRIGGSDTANSIYQNTTFRISTAGGAYGIGLNSAGYFPINGLNQFDGPMGYTAWLEDGTAYAAGVGGALAFRGNFTTGVAGTFAGIQGFKENGTNGDYAGALRFFTRINAGNLTERLRISSAGNVMYYKRGVVNKTTTYTVTLDDDVITCSASGAAFTITLPTAASAIGQSFTFIKTDSSANAITLDGSGSELINWPGAAGATTQILDIINQAVTIYSNGSAWYAV